MTKKRVAYIGHHGSTRLSLKIHRHFCDSGSAEENPGFFTFNQYWKSVIKKDFPGADVFLLPNTFEWKLMSNPKELSMTDEADLNRAMGLDKLFRSQPKEKIRPYWVETKKRCNEFLDRFQPDYVFSELIQSFACFSLFSSCRDRSIPFIQLVSSRIPGRVDFFTGESDVPVGLTPAHVAAPHSKKVAEDFIRSVVDPTYKGPTYIHSFKKKNGLLSMTMMGKASRLLQEKIMGGWIEPTSQSLWHVVRSKLKSNKIKQGKQDIEFTSFEEIERRPEKKILFPLHITPEASTDLWAPNHNDMLEVSQKIVRHLPEGWLLVLKEHPAAVFNQRAEGELEKLKSLPNTFVISPKNKNADLLEKCNASLVVNSTFGLEAILRGYPVITLGNPFYDMTSNTVPCSSYDQLGAAIKAAATKKVDSEKNINFIASYYEMSGAGLPDNPELYPETDTEENVRALAISLEENFLRKETA